MLPGFLDDATVTESAVPTALENATAKGVLWQAGARCFLLKVPDIASYLVEDGRAVTIQPAPQTNPLYVGRFFRMAPLAALLYQRGMMAFHASAVTNGQQTFLLAGDSGAGKSTLLAVLLQRGWMMLADELTAVGLNNQGQVIVWPTFPEIALWPDTMEKLAIPDSQAPRCDANRHLVSRPACLSPTPRDLHIIYWLSVHGKENIEVTNLEGTDRFRATGMLSYNSHIADVLFEKSAHMRHAAAIGLSIPILQLRRPRGKWCVDDLADIITRGLIS